MGAEVPFATRHPKLFLAYLAILEVSCSGVWSNWVNLGAALKRNNVLRFVCEEEGSEQCKSDRDVFLTSLFAAMSMTSAVSTILLGFVADHWGPRPAMLLSSTLFGLALVCFSVGRTSGLFWAGAVLLGSSGLPMHSCAMKCLEVARPTQLKLALLNQCFDMAVLVFTLLNFCDRLRQESGQRQGPEPDAVFQTEFNFWLFLYAVLCGGGHTLCIAVLVPPRAAFLQTRRESIPKRNTKNRTNSTSPEEDKEPTSEGVASQAAPVQQDVASEHERTEPPAQTDTAGQHQRQGADVGDDVAVVCRDERASEDAEHAAVHWDTDSKCDHAPPEGNFYVAASPRGAEITPSPWKDVKLILSDRRYQVGLGTYILLLTRWVVMLGTIDMQLDGLGQAGGTYTLIFGTVLLCSFFWGPIWGRLLEHLSRPLPGEDSSDVPVCGAPGDDQLPPSKPAVVRGFVRVGWVLGSLGVLLSAFNVAPVLEVQVAAFVSVGAWRSLLFSYICSYNASVFGFDRFGKTYGIMTLVAFIIASSATSGLAAWAADEGAAGEKERAFVAPNIVMLFTQVLVFGMPLYLRSHLKALKSNSCAVE